MSTALKGLFDRVIRSNRSLRTRFDEGARVRWTTSCPTTRIQTHELLIYMMQSTLSSVVSAHFPNTRPGGNGVTAWSTGAGGESGSEVYLGRMTPALVARMSSWTSASGARTIASPGPCTRRRTVRHGRRSNG